MQTIEASFDSRRAAELTVERLVQEFGLDRRAITIMPVGARNSAGTEPSGGDQATKAPTPPDRNDAALNGALRVSVQVAEPVEAARVREAFAEFAAAEV